MHLSVLGAGYVGLVTAACLAKLGHQVRCIDADQERVAGLLHGELPLREPGLDELVSENVDAGRLSFHADSAATHATELCFVAVGTLDELGEWTGHHVREAVEALARDAQAPRAIVLRSTLLPGTAVELEALAHSIDPRARIYVNPEFTREATAIADFLAPDRVVIGASPDSAGDATIEDLRRIYHPLQAPIIVTDLTSAEMIKFAANVFLAAKITFANELARLCVEAGADIGAVVDGLGLDRRIGRSFLSPGPGFGGSCFPAQARALPALAERHRLEVPLLRAISPSNDQQPGWLVDRLEVAAGRRVKGMRVAVLGPTFKAGTDDLRESPAR